MTTAARPFYGQPFAWLLFALGLILVPLVGLLAHAGLPWREIHPALNAMLNGLSSAFLAVGGVAIRRKQVALHRQCMLAGLTSSSLFLVSYVIRFAMTGAHRYPGGGALRALYLAILASHTLLAVVVLPLVVTAAVLALRGSFARHRRVARWAWPIWMYVSVTGVVVYLMLYPLAPGR